MTNDEMYNALIHNDANYDGLFFYGVTSTCVFCRPSCPSKKPLREHVRFFSCAKDAVQAGFRPCKRCRSDLLSYRPMEDFAESIKPRLDKLYASQNPWNDALHEIGLSERRSVESFKATYGMTPKAYMDLLKLREATRLLSETDTKVIDIAAAVGFGGLSTFNRFFKAQTGCSPQKYRKLHKVIP